jgi:hypothetical protein
VVDQFDLGIPTILFANTWEQSFDLGLKWLQLQEGLQLHLLGVVSFLGA